MEIAVLGGLLRKWNKLNQEVTFHSKNQWGKQHWRSGGAAWKILLRDPFPAGPPQSQAVHAQFLCDHPDAQILKLLKFRRAQAGPVFPRGELALLRLP